MTEQDGIIFSIVLSDCDCDWTIYTIRAIALARQALHDAGPELASLDEESSNKSAEIMRLMEEKLKQWGPTSPNSKAKDQQPCTFFF